MKKIGLSGSKNLFQNIQRLDHAYGKVLCESGMIPVIIPVMENPECAKTMLEGLDGLILTGGPDIWTFDFDQDPVQQVEYFLPKRDRWEKALYFAAIKMHLPIFGVCRGMQLINVLKGGTLIQDIPSQHGEKVIHLAQDDRVERYHRIHCEGRLKELYGEVNFVNSVHHQAIETLGEGLIATCYAEDDIIEAIESEDGRIFAVQFHPERENLGKERPNLFRWFFGGEA